MLWTMLLALGTLPKDKPDAYKCAVVYSGFGAVEVQSNPTFSSTPVSLAARDRSKVLLAKAGRDPSDFATNNKMTEDASDWVILIPFEQDKAKKMAAVKDLMAKVKACDAAFGLAPPLALTFIR